MVRPFSSGGFLLTARSRDAGLGGTTPPCSRDPWPGREGCAWGFRLWPLGGDVQLLDARGHAGTVPCRAQRKVTQASGCAHSPTPRCKEGTCCCYATSVRCTPNGSNGCTRPTQSSPPARVHKPWDEILSALPRQDSTLDAHTQLQGRQNRQHHTDERIQSGNQVVSKPCSWANSHSPACRLCLNRRLVDGVATDGASILLHIPAPKGHSIPFLHLKPLLAASSCDSIQQQAFEMAQIHRRVIRGRRSRRLLPQKTQSAATESRQWMRTTLGLFLVRDSWSQIQPSQRQWRVSPAGIQVSE